MAGIYQGITAVTLPLSGGEKIAVDTGLTQGINPATELLTTSQLAGYSNKLNSVVAGRFYGVPGGVTPTALLTVTGTLYAYPVYINNDVVLPIKTLGLSVTTGQTGGSARVGIYYDNGGYPGALVTGTDGGALAATATANVSNTLTSSNIILPAGKYWFASIFTASSTFPSVAGTGTGTGYFFLGEVLGSSTQANLLATSAQGQTGISVAATFGALSGINSASFPPGATLTLNAATPLVAIGF